MQISKVVVPIITPFNKQGKVYEKGLENLLGFLSANGIKTIWALGSYGAFSLMPAEDRKYAVEIMAPLAKSLGITLIVQIGSPSTETALDLAGHAEKAGADALATVVPFYYAASHYKERNFLSYFKTILSKTGLPLFYYNNPKTTGYTPSKDFVRALLEAGIAGIKDTTTDFLSITEKIRLFGELKPKGYYLGGSSSVYVPVMAMGGYGAVCGTAVALPELVIKMAKVVEKGDFAKARPLQNKVLRAREIQGTYVGRSVASYDILNARGIDVGTCKSPWISMTKAQTKDVMKKLEALGAL